MASDNRLPSRPGEAINRSKIVTFTYNGTKIEAYEGDTVASALSSKGQKIFGRSFKYHRPRGLFCVSGNCPNCFMNVDGVPNVKSCVIPVREGMAVNQQNAWPSLEHDASSIIDKFESLLPVGFYYKTFHHPKWMWPFVRPFIRRAAGYGKITRTMKKTEEWEQIHKHVDLTVVGGGPAGISAALEAAKYGLRILLVDDQSKLGGHLNSSACQIQGGEEFSGLRGFEAASKLNSAVPSVPNIETLTSATCFGLYEGNLIGVYQSKRLVKVRTRKIIVATGCQETNPSFTNNDLPGIFLGTGLQRLVNIYGIKPGQNALVVANSSSAAEIVSDLLDAGIEVAALVVITSNLSLSNSLEKKIRDKGVQVFDGYMIVEALGNRGVTGAIIAKIGEEGKIVEGSAKTIPCDIISISAGFEPSSALLYQGGCEIAFDEQIGESVPTRMGNDIYAAGEVTGIHDTAIALLQGKIAGAQAANDLRRDGNIRDLITNYNEKLGGLVERYRSKTHPSFFFASPVAKEKKFVCICEDVTEKDLKLAIEEGFDDIETLKRYTTFTMGPCQGKLCSLTCTAIHAKETGLKFRETKRTTYRPPIQPLPMGLLEGPQHRPLKLTPMHHKHVALKANMMNMGEWKRPHDYGSVDEEYHAIRERVGIIDVSTLGRFEVRGRDAGKFLDMVYGHIYSTLKPGKARYALLLSDAAMILDDGIVALISENEYFVTSSTGNAELVESWLKWWQSQSNLQLSVTNMTSGLAGVNVAGPRARELLSKLVNVDLSQKASPYMSCTKASINGVPVVLLRIGFVGETGWELHFPAEYGEYIWNLLLETGKVYGIRPVGVEAMRLLSLEKRHIWPTIDTDAASDPLETDLSWAVKMEKTDFVGKHYVLKTVQRGLEQKIIGFLVNGPAIVESGDVIIADGKPVGRVTNARYSYAQKKYVGLGWVPIGLSKEGTTIRIRRDSDLVDATIVSGAFYDPDGARMKA